MRCDLAFLAKKTAFTKSPLKKSLFLLKVPKKILIVEKYVYI